LIGAYWRVLIGASSAAAGRSKRKGGLISQRTSVRPPTPSSRVPGRCVLSWLAPVGRPAGIPGCAAHSWVQTRCLGGAACQASVRARGGEDARPRARAGASGTHWIRATMAEGCHHILVFH
jgi:hypothetical protein